jgi:hypothetical protein
MEAAVVFETVAMKHRVHSVRTQEKTALQFVQFQ